MKAAVALLCSVAMIAGCFPNNPAARTKAKYVEGGALVAGILVSAIANTGADCDSMDMTMGPNVDNSCRKTAQILSTVGVVLILGGLLGFVATIATAEDIELKKEQKQAMDTPVPKSEVKLPPGVTPPPKSDAQGTGSAATPTPPPATPDASEPPAHAGSATPAPST
jgi:hypothetical protein